MNKISLPKDVCVEFERIAKDKKIFLEGNILKVIDFPDYSEFEKYINSAKENDSNNRRKRLEVTKQVQEQNKKLKKTSEENKKLMEDLQKALEEAENAKVTALNDLDLIQKKTQFELIGNIVSYALYVIVGTGVTTTVLYILAILYNSPETTLIGSTWSNLFGILLTNSFSIIGTIMGVKYASKDEPKNNNK